MIRSLTGEITLVNEGQIVVSVGGIGYLVGATTKTTAYTIGDTITLHTYLAVRENALDLYGFTSQPELELFTLLLSVPKIGPKSALQVLNQASPTLLIESIGKKDGVYLHKMSGVGKKTCENIVLALHEKIENLGFDATVSTGGMFNEAQTDAIDALISLGYDMSSAREAVKAIEDETITATELVSKALKQIK